MSRLVTALIGAPPAAQSTNVSPETGDPLLFEALIKEYELTFNALEQSVGRNVQITTAIVTTLGAALSVIPQIKVQEHYPVIVVLPAFFVVMFGILLFELCTSHVHIWDCRVLARRINSMLPETALIRFEPSYPSATAFSSSRGLVSVRLLQGIMLGGPWLLLFSLLAVLGQVLFEKCGVPVAQSDCTTLGSGLYFCGEGAAPPGAASGPPGCPASIPWIFLLWVPIVIAEIILVSGPMSKIPARYRSFFGDDSATGPFPPRSPVTRAAGKVSGGVRQLGRTMFFWLMPRPWDFVCKWPCFWLGFMTVWVASGISESQVARVNQFIGPLIGGDSWTMATVPSWAVILLALIYFLIEEVGFQQAKFLIDDAQPGDVRRDQTLLQNKGWRAVSAGIISPRQALVYGVIRAGVSLWLALMVGGPLFLIALLLSAAHQLIYVFALKPLARTAPVLILLWISLNLAPRLLAGFVAASQEDWATWITVLVTATFIASSLGGMAAQWKMEARHHGPTVRGQSAYLLDQGERWQRAGFAAAIALPLCTLAAHFVGNAGAALQECLLGATCPPLGLAPEALRLPHPELSMAPLVLLSASLPVMLAWRLVSAIGDKPAPAPHGKGLALGALGLATLALWTGAAALSSVALWLAMLTIMQIWLFVHFQGMAYTEFAVGGLATASRES